MTSSLVPATTNDKSDFCKIAAPKTLLPHSIERLGVKAFTDMKKGLDKCDIVMMLRLQNERMHGSFLPSAREYYEYFGLTPDKLKVAKKEALIMHPGPMTVSYTHLTLPTNREV